MAFASVHAADLVDFESASGPSFLFAGDAPHAQSGYLVTYIGDFGLLGTTADQASFGFAGAPGNASRFLSSFDSSASIHVERADGGSFDLLSIDAAFTSDYYTGSGGYGGGFYAIGSLASDGSAVLGYTDFFGPQTGDFPFATYAGADLFGGFAGLASLRLFACEYDAGGSCFNGDPGSRATFAVDNLVFTSPVPEAPSWILLCIGGLGLLVDSQRRRRPAGTTPGVQA